MIVNTTTSPFRLTIACWLRLRGGSFAFAGTGPADDTLRNRRPMLLTSSGCLKSSTSAPTRSPTCPSERTTTTPTPPLTSSPSATSPVQGALSRTDGIHRAGAGDRRAARPRHREDRLHRADHGHSVGSHRRQEPRGVPGHSDAARGPACHRAGQPAGRLRRTRHPIRVGHLQRQRPVGGVG